MGNCVLAFICKILDDALSKHVHAIMLLLPCARASSRTPTNIDAALAQVQHSADVKSSMFAAGLFSNMFWDTAGLVSGCVARPCYLGCSRRPPDSRWVLLGLSEDSTPSRWLVQLAFPLYTIFGTAIGRGTFCR